MSSTVFDIVREVTNTIQFEEVLRQRHIEEVEAESKEQRNIDPKQISTGSGTVEKTYFMVPSSTADSLNEIQNPDRNGLVLLWSYNLHKIFNGREEGMMAVIRHFYNLGEKSYSAATTSGGTKRGRKKKETESSSSSSSSSSMITNPIEEIFNIRPEDIGFMPKVVPSEMKTSVSEIEYEKLYRFVSECMLPSIDTFQKSWSAGIIYKSVNFRNIALNLFKGTREISLLSN